MTLTEIMALQKRRRTKYRISKNLPFSYTEEMRNLINDQMEVLQGHLRSKSGLKGDEDSSTIRNIRQERERKSRSDKETHKRETSRERERSIRKHKRRSRSRSRKHSKRKSKSPSDRHHHKKHKSRK